MGIISVDWTAEVHEKLQTLPAKVGLNVRVGDVSSVEEVGHHDLDGVGGPKFEARIIFVYVEHYRGAVLEMGCRHSGCDMHW